MYLSHPVRRMRDDPGEETAALVVELADDAEPSELRDTVADAGGELVDEIGFDCWLVRVPEAGVADLCSLPGVVRIETDATLEYAVDETVEPDGGGESAVDDAE
ncbi:hypothetical protein [Halolamina sp. CBA1230]|uniref:hypothetical protein n=1 Tax=Halolamina sp. CBA1230 TaxID=1853690 RepID=UPI0020D1E4A2|nr:hypothetical protein [Halolamina sp. CBA1230]